MLTETQVVLIGLLVLGLVAAVVGVVVTKTGGAGGQRGNAVDAVRTNGCDHARGTDRAAGALLTAEVERFIRSRQAAWRLRC